MVSEMVDDLQLQIRKKVPWLFKGIRTPRIKFPVLVDKSLDIPTPSRNIIMGALYVFLFWLMMGGVYLAIPDSNGRFQIALGANQEGSPIWLYPSINDAFVIESFVAACVIFIGAFGFIVLYQSTKNMYNTAYAQKLIIIGLTMAVGSFTFLQYVVIKEKAGQ